MPQSRFYKPEVLRFATFLSDVQNPEQLAQIQNSLSSDLYGLHAIVSLPTNQPGAFIYHPIPFPPILFKDPIVPYFQYQYLYIVRHELLQIPILTIDYTVTFDTNFANYVESIVRNHSLNKQDPNVKQAIHNILYENLNFDFVFYFIENGKVAYPSVKKLGKSSLSSPLKFWKLLGKKFRWNIVCLSLFQSIDCSEYRNNYSFKYTVSFIEAVRSSVQFVYNFYASKDGQLFNEQYIMDVHKLIMFQLLAILRIQFSSGKSAKSKLKQFLSFIQEKCPVFMDRETILAYKFFKSRNDTPLLNKINKDGTQRDRWDKIDNIAWDLTAVRIMEKIFVLKLKGDYAVPFLLSFDKNLRDFIKAFPTKAVIIDRISEGILSIPGLDTKAYLINEGCGDIVVDFFSHQKQNERFAKVRKNPNFPSPRQLRQEYKSLNLALNSTRV